jgi:uncharacterized DUF497 family protein
MYTASVDIIFDPEKARSNQAKHGVSFAHAEQALRDEFAVTIQDPDHHDEQRFLTLGMDTIGRILVVCHTQRGELTRLISARKASPKETRNYHG